MNTSKQSHFLKEILQSDEISVKTKKNDNLKTKKNQKKSPNTNSNSSCSTSNSHSPEDEEEKLFLLKNENNKGIGIQQRNEVLMKIIVVGEPGVGKTSLINKFVDVNYIVPNNFYKPTIGVDFYRKEFRINDKYILIVFFWDVAGQERFIHMTRSFYNEALAAIVVFSLADKKTLNFSKQWKKDIDQKVFLNPSLLHYLKKITPSSTATTTTNPNKEIPHAARTLSQGSTTSSANSTPSNTFLLDKSNKRDSASASLLSSSENQSSPSTPPGDEEEEVVVPVVLFGNKLDMYLNAITPLQPTTTSTSAASDPQDAPTATTSNRQSASASLRKLIVANASALASGTSDMSPAYSNTDQPNATNAFLDQQFHYQQQPPSPQPTSHPPLPRMNSFIYRQENQKEPSSPTPPELNRTSSNAGKDQFRKEKIAHIEEKMKNFVEENGFAKFFPMSAKTGYLKAVVLNNMKNDGNGNTLGGLLDGNRSLGTGNLIDDEDLSQEEIVALANRRKAKEEENESWKCCG